MRRYAAQLWLLSIFLISFVLQVVLLAVCQVVNAIGPKERLDAEKTYFRGQDLRNNPVAKYPREEPMVGRSSSLIGARPRLEPRLHISDL
jgi:hypothetical protein